MFGKLIPHKEHRQDVSNRNHEEIHPLVRLHREFDDLWDRFLTEGRHDGLSLFGEDSRPGGKINWDEKVGEYVMRAELPGFDPQEIDVKVSGNVLTLKAEHREEGDEKHGRFHHYGSFYESMTLPSGIQDDKIDARYHNGVLELRLPKSESSNARRITVQSD